MKQEIMRKWKKLDSNRKLDPKQFTFRAPTPKDVAFVLQSPEDQMSMHKRKLFEFYEEQEKKMLSTDIEVHLREQEYRKRPPPTFKMGQSVHHFWAGWFANTSEMPKQLKKKGHPKWFSGQVNGPAEWKTLDYASQTIEDWTYPAF